MQNQEYVDLLNRIYQDETLRGLPFSLTINYTDLVPSYAMIPMDEEGYGRAKMEIEVTEKIKAFNLTLNDTNLQKGDLWNEDQYKNPWYDISYVFYGGESDGTEEVGDEVLDGLKCDVIFHGSLLSLYQLPEPIEFSESGLQKVKKISQIYKESSKNLHDVIMGD